MGTDKPVPRATYVAYGIPALPLTLVAITFFVYASKFYSDVVGVDLAVVGLITIISRAWDAVIDPLMGRISDNTRSRWGRRKPWMAAAALPLVASFYFIMNPAANSTGMAAHWWLAIWTILFFFFWTVVNVPYEAWGAEISFNFHERTKLLGLRDGALVLGTLLVAIFPLLYQYFATAPSESEKYFVLSLLYGAMVLVALGVCLYYVPERRWQQSQMPTVSFWQGISEVLANRPFRILLLAYTIGAFGAMLPSTLILYYVEYVLEGTMDAANAFLGLYFVVGFLCLPAWIYLAGKIGKKESWICAMLINTGAFAGVFFLGKGDLGLYGLLVAVSGVGFGATLAIPSSMQADVIDYDQSLHGSRREGQFIGFWSIAKKFSAALGAGVALPILGWAGYQPNVAQSEGTLWTLSFLYAGVPCICNFIAMIIAWRYPIDQLRYQEIRQVIDSRNESLTT